MLKGKLRIELCADASGFWLEEHVDISEKLMTLQIYSGLAIVYGGTHCTHNPE